MLLRTSIISTITLGLMAAAVILLGAQEKKDRVPCAPDPNGMNVYWYWANKPETIYFHGNYVGPDAPAKADTAVAEINKCNSASAYLSPYPCPYPYNPFKNCADTAQSPISGPTIGLCRAAGIKYKAFARSFTPGKPGCGEATILYLVATCYYDHTTFSVFFQRDSGKFKLMQKDPGLHFPFLCDYHIATWPPSETIDVTPAPAHVVIEDGYGEHQIDVEPWK